MVYYQIIIITIIFIICLFSNQQMKKLYAVFTEHVMLKATNNITLSYVPSETFSRCELCIACKESSGFYLILIILFSPIIYLLFHFLCCFHTDTSLKNYSCR